jgi:uncharacterized membrane protein YvlD (DUF360 family)
MRAVRDLAHLYRRELQLWRDWRGGTAAAIGYAVAVAVVSIAAVVAMGLLVPGARARDLVAAAVAGVAMAAATGVARPALFAVAAPSVVLAFALLLVRAAVVLLLSSIALLAVDGLGAALLGAVAYSVVNTALAAALVLGADEAFFGTLVRELAARYRHARRGGDGVVFLQIDGLGHALLREALRAGRMPHLARRVAAGDLVLDRWEALLPSQTSASQAGILHGNNDGIPGFRWWDKRERRLLVSNHPADARVIERRVSNGRGLLAQGGASVGNLLSGDATRSFLTAATVGAVAREARRSHVLAWFYLTPYAVLRWVGLSIGEIAKELAQARGERIAGVEPRGVRGFPYPLARAATNVLLRHLTAALVVEEMFRGARVVYANFVDYDEIAHHSGIDRVEARDALAGLDRVIALIAKAAAAAPRRYRLVLLSDHGQSPGATFRQRYGRGVDAVIRDLVGDAATVHAATGHAEHGGRAAKLLSEFPQLGRLAAPLAYERARRSAGHWTEERPPDIVVAASGNLAHIALPRHEGRAAREEIETRYPGLIDGLVAHHGIGFVMVHSGSEGTVVRGKGGEHRLRDGHVAGADPIAGYGPRALEGLRRVDRMAECGDLVLVSSFDPETGEVAAFEEQVGSHGGLGGAQVHAFVLHPREWTIDEPIVGAPALHRLLKRWAASPDATSATA